MEKEITLLKNNSKRDWSDLQWLEEFYIFLQGISPDNISARPINLSANKAFTIIWYLQEHFPVFPDRIEQCSICKDLYDSYSSGYHSELTGKFYCNNCFPPFLDEKEEKIAERRYKKSMKPQHKF